MFDQFGIGGCLAIPVGGNLATPSQPIQFLTLQDVGVDIDQKLVGLMGQDKGPDDMAPSDMTIKCKAAFGRLDANAYNAIMFGETMQSGISVSVPYPGIQETIATSVTPVVPNSGSWSKDGGVYYTATGQPLKRVPSSPSTGQYSVSSGVYTFNSGDNGTIAQIYFVYTLATGQTLTVHNQLQGYGPVFECYLAMPFQGNFGFGSNGIHLYQCRFAKTSFPLKRNAWVISDFEFEAYPNASGNWFDLFENDTF
ncbi:MAG: hypothetical protein KGL39_51180 [Patescibacteria group bacterium]|nr:hypothetical protein [Patescibacteria group bacterium]